MTTKEQIDKKIIALVLKDKDTRNLTTVLDFDVEFSQEQIDSLWEIWVKDGQEDTLEKLSKHGKPNNLKNLFSKWMCYCCSLVPYKKNKEEVKFIFTKLTELGKVDLKELYEMWIENLSNFEYMTNEIIYENLSSLGQPTQKVEFLKSLCLIFHDKGGMRFHKNLYENIFKNFQINEDEYSEFLDFLSENDLRTNYASFDISRIIEFRKYVIKNPEPELEPLKWEDVLEIKLGKPPCIFCRKQDELNTLLNDTDMPIPTALLLENFIFFNQCSKGLMFIKKCIEKKRLFLSLNKEENGKILSKVSLNYRVAILKMYSDNNFCEGLLDAN